MNFNFPAKTGTGISKLLPHDHVSQECIELIELMCTYDPDERYLDFTSCIVICTRFYSIVIYIILALRKVSEGFFFCGWI